MNALLRYSFFLLLLILQFACGHGTIRSRSEAFQKIQWPMQEKIIDQGEESTFIELLKTTQQFFELYPQTIPSAEFLLKGSDYSLAMSYLLQLYKENKNNFYQKLTEDFILFESKAGEDFDIEYLPKLQLTAKKNKDSVYLQPIFGKPNDLVQVDLDAYREAFTSLQNLSSAEEQDIYQRGFFFARKLDKYILPYWSKQEILAQNEKEIRKKNKILFWMKLEEARSLDFFGQAEIHLEGNNPENKTNIFVEYIGDNNKIWPQNSNESDSYLAFFREKSNLNEGANTRFYVKLLPARTLAINYNYYPKGILALYKNNQGKTIYLGAHDIFLRTLKPTEGTIYTGRPQEKIEREKGKLYFILPSENLIQRLKLSNSEKNG